MKEQKVLEFGITIHGQGGHGSRPDQSHNPVDCFIAIHGALMQFRSLDPALPCTCSITKVEGSELCNIIPDDLWVSGTFRYFDDKDAARFKERLPLIAQSLSQRWLCTAETSVK